MPVSTEKAVVHNRSTKREKKNTKFENESQIIEGVTKFSMEMNESVWMYRCSSVLYVTNIYSCIK